MNNKRIEIAEKSAFLKIIEISEEEIEQGKTIPIEKAFDELQIRIEEFKKFGLFKNKEKS